MSIASDFDRLEFLIKQDAMRIAELEERLTVEQPCNYCRQYHGKDVCEELLAENKRLFGELEKLSRVEEMAEYWLAETLRLREALDNIADGIIPGIDYDATGERLSSLLSGYARHVLKEVDDA